MNLLPLLLNIIALSTIHDPVTALTHSTWYASLYLLPECPTHCLDTIHLIYNNIFSYEDVSQPESQKAWLINWLFVANQIGPH